MYSYCEKERIKVDEHLKKKSSNAMQSFLLHVKNNL